MDEKVFGELPVEIRSQIESLLDAGENSATDGQKEQYARVWKNKLELFTAQIANIGMDFIPLLAAGDKRGCILLTYSGSLISAGPETGGKRWLEYASIKFRHDVPDFIQGNGISLPKDIRVDETAEFEGCALRQSSAVYRIAVCPEGTSSGDQDQRIKEATIYLTNGFVKINRTLGGLAASEIDQFTVKSIVAYLAKKHSLTQTQTRSLIDDFVSTLEAGILLGERVAVGKLGIMSLKPMPAKKARVMNHPSTGKEILVPAKPACYTPKFGFSKAIKEKSGRVNPEHFIVKADRVIPVDEAGV